MCEVIQIDPEVMGGAPVFKGTRVPISTLFDYLSDITLGEDPIAEFLDNFPGVSPQQVSDLLGYYYSRAKNQRAA
jgi:uncharacterized protein (DUF433 family)